LEDGYTDEFGAVLPEVYRTAGELWPQAESFIHTTIRDCAAGLRLMIKAAAAVSREIERRTVQIQDPKAYLWVAFRRLILDELKKENRYQSLETDEEPPADSIDLPKTLIDKILIGEMRAEMDSWTRTVFDMRALEYPFEEIARMIEMRPNALRSKFSKEMKKLRRRLKL
jgi:DNA-directed RNA polymerase specialized sigma24 family protein